MSITIAGKSVSAIGLGCATFGREISEQASYAMMDYAQAHGVTLFDTAAAYGAGVSERIVGNWLAAHPASSVVLATKLLPPYEPATLAKILEQSLCRLGVETLDLLYLHHWHASVEGLELLTMLDRFVRSGKIRALGASNFTAAQLSAALRRQTEAGLARFQVVQHNHNFAVSDLTPELLDICTANGIAIVTYSPLGAGFLTGKHRRGVQAGSRFAILPGHQDIYFQERSWRRLERLEAAARRSGHNTVCLALAWVLHSPQVTSVLIGGRTPAHLDQAFAAQLLNDPKLLAEMQAE
jgi:aryl-alcohol dehydrogenase-like predicted oxidoreductase